MPRVQEYLPEQEAQGPVGQTSPMLEEVTMFGRGIETLGKDLSDAGTIIHQRETQVETSDAYASVAEQRAAMMAEIQDRTAKGTLDVDAVKKDYQAWVEKQYDTYNTAAGKNAFVRASSRAGGAIVTHAARGYAVIQGARARENLSTLLNNNSAMVEKDPSQFHDVLQAQMEAVQNQVDAGALSQPEAEKAHIQMAQELSKSAIRGYMQSDYDNIKNAVIASDGKKHSVDPNAPGLNTSLAKLNSGEFDSFLDSSKKRALEQEIRANQAAAQTAGRQAIAIKKDAVSAQGEQFKVQSYEKLQGNALTPEEVTKAARSGLITSDEQLKMYHLIEQAGKAELQSNPTIKNMYKERILSPDNAPGHINDVMDLAMQVGPGGLTMRDFKELQETAMLNPVNQVNNFNEGKLLQKAKSMIGEGDPAGEYKLAQFSSELHKAKKEFSAQQKPISALLDPASPDYFGAQIQKYVSTPADILHQQAEAARGKAFAPANVQTAPGVSPKPGDGTQVNDTVTPDKIFAMSKAELMKLNPQSLSKAERAAAAARFEQLRGKK